MVILSLFRNDASLSSNNNNKKRTQVGKKQSMRVAAIGALGLYALSSQAQEGPADGLAMTLDVDQRFGIDTNEGLTSGGEEDSKFSSTQLTFGLTTDTAVDSLSLIVSGDIRITDGPDDPGTEFGVDSSSLRLSYNRDTGNSALTFRTNYRLSDVDTTLPFSDFIDPNTGNIVLPDDLDSLNGTGTRRSLGFNGSLELFKYAPVGLILDASHNTTTYSDTSDPDLTRNERLSLGATVRLTLSPVLEGNLNVRHSSFEDEDVDMTESNTDNVSFGLIYDASQSAQYHGNIGYAVSDKDEGVGIARMRTHEEGVTGSFGADFLLPNGSISPEITSDVTTNARRNTLNVARVYELPNALLSGSLGLTHGEANETNIIGSLRFTQAVPNGDINVLFNRYVSEDSDDDERLYSALSIGYSHEINNFSSLDLRTSFTTSNTTAKTDLNTRIRASATYRYDVTQDWSLSTGYIFRQRDDATSASADSHSLFFGIGRRFDLQK
jgi:hypothetical protein